MITTDNMKPGDQVYLVRFNGWEHDYYPAIVTNRTPKGMLDIQKAGSKIAERYQASGRKFGDKSYRPLEIDLMMPFADRLAYLQREKRLRLAWGAVDQIKCEERIRKNSSVDEMRTELNRLQSLLDAAHAAVNAVDSPILAPRPVLPNLAGTMTCMRCGGTTFNYKGECNSSECVAWRAEVEGIEVLMEGGSK